jgi:hypothetical protein
VNVRLEETDDVDEVSITGGERAGTLAGSGRDDVEEDS